MSQETMEWLWQNTRVGFCEEKKNLHWGNRPWTMPPEGLDHPNFYPGAVPIEAVLDLFDWEAEESPLFLPAVGGAEDGGMIEVPNRKAILRSDTRALLGIFKDGYECHQYREWLLNKISRLLDADLSIAGAILLRGGARAFVTVEMPENVDTPEGLSFRPMIFAGTSFDGSLASTYGRGVTIGICDNTADMMMAEGKASGQLFKVRHSKYSNSRDLDIRAALDIVHSIADDFSAMIAEWTATPVTDKDFDKFLNNLVPVPEEEGRGKTRAENRHADLRTLWNTDPRCEPWKGTALGVFQTMNTFSQHEATVRGGGARLERNTDNLLTGKVGAFDANVMDTLAATLA